MNDAAGLVDEEHAGGQPIQDIGKCCGFGGLEIDRPADMHRAAKVGNDEAHALTRSIIDNAMALVPKNAKHGGTRRRLVEHGADE
ncbi:MAG TPA: hypothetical protein VF051_08745, partial [Hyphomicrobiaceae bacterium]